MAGLEDYHKKRNFQRTPEPAGEAGARAEPEGGLFVVHKHAARRLHYDLRLEQDGVLKSWAVPKGPGLKPGEKHLAVRVEDHPLEYGDFEGVIPQGEYGAGTVMLWDRGRWVAKWRDSDRIDFVLEGQKLRGTWSLVRMGGRAAEDGDNWLLIKRSEPARQRKSAKSKSANRKAALPENVSVATGRTMEQIKVDRSRTWSSQGEAHTAPPVPDAAKLAGAHRRPLPRDPRPQLATLAEAAPDGDAWVHEIKFDGYRILARIEQRAVRLISRNGLDWTSRFPEIAGVLEALPVDDALLDGEVVALGADGVSSFGRLQEALSAGRTARLVYQVFDLRHLNGVDLDAVALRERKRALEQLMDAADLVGSATIRYTDHIAESGQMFFEHACRLGLEGIISKRVAARYRETRSKDWLKVKCTQHQELLIGGYTDPGGSRTGFGALLLGGWRGERLVYAGKVGTGFSERQLKDLLAQLKRRAVKTSPFDTPPAGKGLHWVRPELIAEVEFSEWTRDGALRHPRFRGLREDRNPQEIQLPQQLSSSQASAPAPGTRRRSGDTTQVAGVRLSNPDRVLYPQQGLTKLALAEYYADIEDWILPQLAERPLSLLRCPQGRHKECFFQKHPQQTLAKDFPKLDIMEKNGLETYVYVRSLPDLVGLVQVGTLELHVWGSRVKDVERPDILVFDLDPAPDVKWTEVLRTARSLRERLQTLGLESFVRTTGGKGLHLVVPLAPRADWEATKAFARALANAHARDDRRRVTTNMSKAKREGRIFLDYLRNGRGATAIASYSTRAREGAPVAVPVRWEELNAALTSDRYTADNLRRRLSALRGDPWDGFEEARRPLDSKLLNAVGAGDKA
ncbi:MAG: DNA ligase D [Thiogranum sp.]|nr:DNA ligase D [Thiogranum sp.]